MLFRIHSVLINSYLSEHDTDTLELDSKIVSPQALGILWSFVENKQTALEFSLNSLKFNITELVQAADYLQFTPEFS